MTFKKNNQRVWITLFLTIIFFILELMVISNSSILYTMDHSIQDVFSNIVSSSNTKLFSAITSISSPKMDAIYLVLLMIVLYRNKKRILSFWLGFTLVSGNIIAFLIKITVKRQRPINKIVPDSGYSFPSGHVFGTMLLVLTLMLLIVPSIKKQSIKYIINLILILWVIIVAASRVYLRGHFPSDTLGSVILALTWWDFSEMLYIRYYTLIANLFEDDSEI